MTAAELKAEIQTKKSEIAVYEEAVKNWVPAKEMPAEVESALTGLLTDKIDSLNAELSDLMNEIPLDAAEELHDLWDELDRLAITETKYNQTVEALIAMRDKVDGWQVLIEAVTPPAVKPSEDTQSASAVLSEAEPSEV